MTFIRLSRVHRAVAIRHVVEADGAVEDASGLECDLPSRPAAARQCRTGGLRACALDCHRDGSLPLFSEGRPSGPDQVAVQIRMDL
jgi:hypothetical protein